MTEDFSELLGKTIDHIVSLFKGPYLDQEGCPVYTIDGHTGSFLDSRNLLPELDDYLPFFWLLGEHDFVMTQVEALKKRISLKPLLFTRPQIRKFRGIGLPRP